MKLRCNHRGRINLGYKNGFMSRAEIYKCVCVCDYLTAAGLIVISWELEGCLTSKRSDGCIFYNIMDIQYEILEIYCNYLSDLKGKLGEMKMWLSCPLSLKWWPS